MMRGGPKFFVDTFNNLSNVGQVCVSETYFEGILYMGIFNMSIEVFDYVIAKVV